MKQLLFPFIPEDKFLLAQVGRMAIVHSQLDYTLKMLIRQLEGWTVSKAQEKLEFTSFGAILKRIREIIKDQYVDFDAYDELKGYLDQADVLNKKRNDYFHGLWTQELDGDTKIIRFKDEREFAIPDETKLKDIVDEMISLIKDIHRSRLEGSIKLSIESHE